MKYRSFFMLLLIGTMLFVSLGCERSSEEIIFSSTVHANEIAKLESLPEGLGVAGAFSGVHNDVLLIAGGANFPQPIWDEGEVKVPKVYHSQISALKKVVNKNKEISYEWQESNASLAEVRAYGYSVTTDKGVILIGGHNSEKTFDNVDLLSWDEKSNSVVQKSLPSLPMGITLMSAVTTSYSWNDAIVYLIGGNSSEKIEDVGAFFYSLKLSDIGKEGKGQWQKVGELPGGKRSVPIAAWQHDGKEFCLFVFSGRRAAPEIKVEGVVYPYGMELLTDGWKWIPSTQRWMELSDTPVSMCAGAGWTWGLNHVLVMSLDDGEYMKKAFLGEMDLQKEHPGFKKVGYAYHGITDTWCKIENLPTNQVHISATKWGGGATDPIVVVPGEIMPRVRSNAIYTITVEAQNASFGAFNYLVIVLYLLAMLGVGVFFYFKDRKAASIDTFFKGGGKIPFWVAAFSLFATMLSSITFVAVPGKAYATDWTNFLLTISMLLVTPFVIRYFLPFFRGIKSASAYEYLEKRFNLLSRIFAGTIFMVYHILRMGIVMYLPALALSSILKLSPDPQLNMIYSILIMGLLSVVYCSLGGLSAVVWTDTIQSFILLGAAFVTVIIIISKIGGFGEFFSTASAAGKFDLALPDFSANSFKNPVLWVILLGGIGQNLIPYASDQSIIQRYMAVKDTREAKKSIWTNAFLSIGARALFFFVGTALFVFYKNFPGDLDPSLSKVDEIFPRFIIEELPIGIAGLVVAAILAAAQSTVSTSINSATAVMISDFLMRFSKKKRPKLEIIISRVGSAVFGLLGTIFGLVLVGLNNTSIWDSFLSMLGLVLGALCGLFLLGIFFKRANGMGAIMGILFGILTTVIAQRVGVHPYLYGVVNLVATTFWGYLFSLKFRLFGLTGETTLEKMSGKGYKAGFYRWFYTLEGNGEKYSYQKKIK